MLAVVPIFAEAALATLVPAYREVRSSSAFRLPRVLLFTFSITILPVAATYAALSSTCWTSPLSSGRPPVISSPATPPMRLIASPLAVFLVIVFYNRERTVIDLLTGSGGVATAAVAGVGIFLMLVRERLLRHIDRRFFRQPADAGATLLALSDSLRGSTTVDELSPLAAGAVADAFHPERIVTIAARRRRAVPGAGRTPAAALRAIGPRAVDWRLGMLRCSSNSRNQIRCIVSVKPTGRGSARSMRNCWFH